MSTQKHGGKRQGAGRPEAGEPRNIKKQLCWTKPEWDEIKQCSAAGIQSVNDFQRGAIIRCCKLFDTHEDDLKIYTFDKTKKIYGFYDNCAHEFHGNPDGGTWEMVMHTTRVESMRFLSKVTYGSLYENFRGYLELGKQDNWQMINTIVSPESHEFITSMVLKGHNASKILDRAIKLLARNDSE